MSLGFIRDKIDVAISRLQRLAWIPVSLAVKAKLIQSAVWPLALYSIDTTWQMARCLKCHRPQLPFKIFTCPLFAYIVAVFPRIEKDCDYYAPVGQGYSQNRS